MIERVEVVADGGEGAASEPPATVSSFEAFAATTGLRLRIALVARYGVEVGVDACGDALAYAWEHWGRVGRMDNPAGYLFRVGQTSVRRQRRAGRPVGLPPAETVEETSAGPALHEALARLDDRQRTAVVLAHVYGWSYAEIGALLRVPVSTVRNLVHRGMTKLRRLMEA